MPRAVQSIVQNEPVGVYNQYEYEYALQRFNHPNVHHTVIRLAPGISHSMDGIDQVTITTREPLSVELRRMDAWPARVLPPVSTNTTPLRQHCRNTQRREQRYRNATLAERYTWRQHRPLCKNAKQRQRRGYGTGQHPVGRM